MEAKLQQLSSQLEAMTSLVNELLGAPIKANKGKSLDKEPRAPTPWGSFTARVRQILKDNNKKPNGLETQFCSMLKTQKSYDDWSDSEILAAREGWVEPPKKEKVEGEKPAKLVKVTKVKVEKVDKVDKVVAPVEQADDAEKMEPSSATIGGKPYFVNGFGDVFDETTFAYLGAQKGDKIVKGAAPARVVKYLADANN